MPPAPDPLGDLRDRLRQTADAAERLAREAPPRQGWATPEEQAATAAEAQALLTLLAAVREVIPPELWAEIRDLVRRLVLLLRTVLDLLLERLDEERPDPVGGVPVQDIPVV